MHGDIQNLILGYELKKCLEKNSIDAFIQFLESDLYAASGNEEWRNVIFILVLGERHISFAEYMLTRDPSLAEYALEHIGTILYKITQRDCPSVDDVFDFLVKIPEIRAKIQSDPGTYLPIYIESNPKLPHLIHKVSEITEHLSEYLRAHCSQLITYTTECEEDTSKELNQLLKNPIIIQQIGQNREDQLSLVRASNRIDIDTMKTLLDNDAISPVLFENCHTILAQCTDKKVIRALLGIDQFRETALLQGNRVLQASIQRHNITTIHAFLDLVDALERNPALAGDLLAATPDTIIGGITLEQVHCSVTTDRLEIPVMLYNHIRLAEEDKLAFRDFLLKHISPLSTWNTFGAKLYRSIFPDYEKAEAFIQDKVLSHPEWVQWRARIITFILSIKRLCITKGHPTLPTELYRKISIDHMLSLKPKLDPKMIGALHSNASCKTYEVFQVLQRL